MRMKALLILRAAGFCPLGYMLQQKYTMTMSRRRVVPKSITDGLRHVTASSGGHPVPEVSLVADD